MKESTESVIGLQVIVLFILLFAAFLSLILCYSRSFMVKNQMLTTIEKYGGINTDSINVINNFALQKGYNEKGKCKAGWYGSTSLKDIALEEVKDENKKYYYCFKVQKIYLEKSDRFAADKYKTNVQVFYRFNIPILGDISNFKIEGTTNGYYANNGNFEYIDNNVNRKGTI